MQPVAPPPLPGALTEPWSLGKLARMLRMFGPAAILASVSIGAGETIIVVRAGAWLGYGVLWLILLSVLAKGVCVTYFLGRYTAISGETPGARLAKLPGPRGWLLIAFVVLELAAAPALWAAIALPSGELLSFLSLGAEADPALRKFVTCAIATTFIAAALLLSLPASYRFLERQQLVICGILVLGTIVGTLMVRPDYTLALQGLFDFGNIPQVPPTAPEAFRLNAWPLLAVTFGYVGGSVMTYLVYPDFISLHGWGMTGHPQWQEIRRRAAAGAPGDYLPTTPDEVRTIRRATAPIRWDVACGALVLLVVTASFMMSGAAVLFPRREAGEALGAFEGWHLLTDQASIWSAIHPALVWVYYVCVIAALWGTLQAYPDVYARGITEYARALAPHRAWRQRTVQIWVSLFVFATATAVIWSDVDFNLLTMTVNFLATTLGVALAMLAGLYLNQQLPPAYRTRWWMRLAGIASAVLLIVVSGIAGVGVWQQIIKFFQPLAA
jgi:Mn2+/Fe2+ NRAMP family transporter